MILSLSLLPHVSLYFPSLLQTPAVLVTDSVIKLNVVTVSSHFLFSFCFACNITSMQSVLQKNFFVFFIFS